MTIARDLSKILDANGDLTIDTSTLFVDSSTNRVGIGTTSPSSSLEVNGTITGGSLISGASTDLKVVSGGNSTTNGSNIVFYGGSHATEPNVLKFRYGTTETMRIDSSGNVLVGKTSSGVANVGAEFRNGSSNYALLGTASSEAPLILNRTTSDGDIIKIRKDNTTVGSIASVDGNSIMIGDGNTNLRFYSPTNVVIPSDSSGSNQSNVVSLGNASSTFKDLYLGGNIYLGGTGSANALDDYEEGSWTPTLIQSTTNPTITYNRQLGHYTKIGRLVLLTGNMYSTSVTNGSGNVRIGGLPFVINAQDQGMEGGASIGYANGFTSTNSPQTAYCPRNNSFVNLMTNDTSDGRNNLDIPVTNTGTLIDINFTVVYMTS